MAERLRKTSSRQHITTNRRYDEDGRQVGHPPTEQYLNALLQQGYIEQDRQREVDERVDDLLKDQHPLDLPDLGIESEEYRGGHAMELVQQIVEFWPKPPQISIPTPGIGEGPEDFANGLEKGLNALIRAQAAARRGPGGMFYDHLKRQVAAYGRGYASVLPNRRAWREMPLPPTRDGGYDLDDPERAKEYLKAYEGYAKGKMPPLALRSIPARRVIPFFDEDGLAECFWVNTERAWEVMERAKARGVPANRLLSWMEQDFDTHCSLPVSVIHYANRRFCAEMVSTPESYPPTLDNPDWYEDCDLLGDPYEHWLEDRIPVAYFPGMTTPLDERHLQAVSVVWQMRNTITMYDRIASMKATAIRTWAWPTPVLKTSLVNANLIEAGDDGRPRPVELTPGMVATLWGDEELYFLTYQGQGPDQDEMMGLLQRQLDRLGLPAVQNMGQDSSGYMFAQFRATMRGKWGAMATGLAQGWEDLAWIELEYLKRMPGSVYIPTVADVGWGGMGKYASPDTRTKSSSMRIKTDQLRSRQFEVVVSLEPDKTMDMIAMAQAGNAMLPLGIPKRYIWEQVLGIEDTSEMRLQSMLEKLQETPEYMQGVFLTALKEGNILIEQEANAGGELPEGVQDLMDYPIEQIQAMAQAGVITPDLAMQAIQAQQANAMQGQVGGALAGGQMPNPAEMMGGAPGGAPGMPPAMGGPVAPPAAPSGPLGPPGGAPNTAAMGAGPAAPPRPRGIGRAPGQSRQPPMR